MKTYTGTVKSGKYLSQIIEYCKKYYGIKWYFMTKKTKRKIIEGIYQI